MEKFVIRVYGIVINDEQEVLISDEFVHETYMSKFPGGGLEFGEGSVECLIREFKEECNGQEIQNIRHFYTTDFYQKALFYNNAQLISIYYLADLKRPLLFQASSQAFDFVVKNNFGQSFRWIKIKNLEEADVTFPIDKFVVRKLKQTFDE